MKRTIEALYWLGDVVYLRVNEERKPGMVTCVSVVAHGALCYRVGWRGGADSIHYECELTSEYVPNYDTADSQREAS